MAIQRTDITSDDQWHALRAPNIGASEIGALFGVHDYATPYSLSAQKLGLLSRETDSEAMERGRLLEPVAITLLRKHYPNWRLVEPRAYFCDVDARIGATPDLFAFTGPGEVRPFGTVQIKSVEPSAFARNWHDDDGEVAVPQWIRLQAMLEGYLCAADFAMVAALVIGHGVHLELVKLAIDYEWINAIYERAALFWRFIDAGRTLDPDYGRDGALLAKVLSQDNDREVDMSGDNELPVIAARYEAAQQARKMAADLFDECKARLLHRIGEAARVKFAGGSISAKTVHRNEFVMPASQFRKITVRMSRGGNGTLSEGTLSEGTITKRLTREDS